MAPNIFVTNANYQQVEHWNKKPQFYCNELYPLPIYLILVYLDRALAKHCWGSDEIAGDFRFLYLWVKIIVIVNMLTLI